MPPAPAHEGDRAGSRRFAYRRLHVQLGREGYLISHKKLFSSTTGKRDLRFLVMAAAAGDRDRSPDDGADRAE